MIHRKKIFGEVLLEFVLKFFQHKFEAKKKFILVSFYLHLFRNYFGNFL